MSCGVTSPSPPWRCSVLYQPKKSAQCARPSSMAPKRSGKSGRYFIVLNCDSEKGLSFEHVRPRVALRYAQVGEHQRDRLRGHRGAALGVDGRLAVRQHPADHVPAVNVEDHVQVEVGPLLRAGMRFVPKAEREAW